jgi:hypothetical protein
MDNEQTINAFKAGKFSQTMVVAKANMSAPLYMAHGEGWDRYSRNPHEELAFSGGEFIERELRKRGIAAPPTLPANHSTIVNINRHGFK